MTFTFFSNFLNHHQLPLCLAWHKALGNDFTFVATQPFDAREVAESYQDMNTAYAFCLPAYKNAATAARAQQLANSSDIVLYGAAPISLFAARLAQGKLTFRYSERIFKPYYTKNMLYTYLCAVWESLRYNRRRNAYLLTAGAYAAHDYAIAGGFCGRAYRWGYFPAVGAVGEANACAGGAADAECATKQLDANDATKAANLIDTPRSPLRLLWVGRMISYKHAEKVLPLALALQNAHLPFVLTMAGDGPLRAALAQKFAPLGDAVQFVGTLSLEATRVTMQSSDIFLMTADESEGWGAVLSEAMADGCAVLASHACGATPFLVRDGENGLLFDLSSEDDFVQKGLALAQNAALRRSLSAQATATMQGMWNAQVAAQRFLQLATALTNGKTGQQPAWADGPCSRDAVLTPHKMQKSLHRRAL